MSAATKNACFAVERARRNGVKLGDSDELIVTPEGRSPEEHLVELFLAAHGDELAAGSVKSHVGGVALCRAGTNVEVVVRGRAIPASSRAIQGAIEAVRTLGAKRIVAALRSGSADISLDLDSIAGFGRTESRRGWEAGYFGVECPFGDPDELWTEWQFGVPIERILAVLEALEAQGWRVARVSEDRGLFRGSHTDNDSAVTRIRHWLVRP